MVHILMLLWQHFWFPRSLFCRNFDPFEISSAIGRVIGKWTYYSCFGMRPFTSPYKVTNRNIWFKKEKNWNQKCCHSNIKICTVRCISYGKMLLPSFNYFALVVTEILPIMCFFTMLSQIIYVISYLIWIIQNHEYFWNEKRYREKENIIFLQFERPFKWAELVFHFIGTLKRTKYWQNNEQNRGKQLLKIIHSP